MRAFVATIATLALVVTASSALAGQSAGPALRLAALSPFTIKGVHFRGRERVRLTVDRRVGADVVRTMRATPSGSFRASFGTAFDPCDVDALKASGSRGSRATFKLPALLSERMCPVPPEEPGAVDPPAAPDQPVVTPAVLSLVDQSPATLRGTRFVPGESVQVTAILQGGEERRTTRATTDGNFLVTFSGAVDPCSFEARAVGARGSVAAFKLPERMCQID